MGCGFFRTPFHFNHRLFPVFNGINNRMKIFRLSQNSGQMMMPFYDDIEPTMSTIDIQHNEDTLNQVLEEHEPKDLNGTIFVLNKYGFEFEIIDFPNDKVIAVNIDEKIYIIDSFYYPSAELGHNWVSDLSDMAIMSYLPDPPEFNQEFWQDPINPLYHATNEKYLDAIKKRGLLPRNESRGISNRSTGAAVFTSDSEEGTDSYGNVIVMINTGSMKQDGYTPYVSKEEPLEEESYKSTIAWKVGIRDYEPSDSYGSEGIYESTIIIHDKVPPKYLSFKNRYE